MQKKCQPIRTDILTVYHLLRRLHFYAFYDVQFGARPLKRAIQTYLEDGLSELIISSELQTGDTISVSLNEEKGELDIKKA